MRELFDKHFKILLTPDLNQLLDCWLNCLGGRPSYDILNEHYFKQTKRVHNTAHSTVCHLKIMTNKAKLKQNLNSELQFCNQIEQNVYIVPKWL